MSIDSQLLNLTGGIKTSGHIKSNFGATIGVGTDAPTGIVEVQHSQPTLVVQQQATSGGSVTSYGKVHAASGTLHIQSGIDATSDSKGDIVLGSVGSGTKHVVVKGATSRVGIGSDAPAYGLDVVPESRFTGNVIASNISTNVLTLNELTLGVTQGLDNVVNVDNTTSNTIAMSNVDESTSTTTGALTVAGGIGVGGNVHCANLYASNITMNLVSFSGLQTFEQVVNNGRVLNSNVLIISNATPSTSSTTGALTLTGGGLGVAGNVHVGSNLTVTDETTLSNLTVTEETALANISVTGETVEVANLAVTSGSLELTQVANVFQVKSSANVVTEYVRSKKLIKYPRVAFPSGQSATGASGYTYSGYTIKASSEYPGGGSSTFLASNAFSVTNTNDFDTWISGASDYATSTGLPVSITANMNKFGENGSWLEIKLPVRVKLQYHQVFSRRTHITERIKKYNLWASNTGNDLDWVKLESSATASATYTDTQPHTSHVNSNTLYQYYAIQITHIETLSGLYGYTNIGEWELYGVPEYDPDAHGTDVIARSVPNVPNTDWLEVYYDGQDYTSMPSTITDKSGNSVTGTPTNVTFDSTWKAFTFNASSPSSIATSSITTSGGDLPHSWSVWIKPEDVSGSTKTYMSVFALGLVNGNGVNQNPGLTLARDQNRMQFGFNGNNLLFRAPFEFGKWVHVAMTYAGGGATWSNRKLYVNGLECAPSGIIGAATNLNMSTSASLNIGTTWYSGDYENYNGALASLRFHGRALSSDEIWQLYAYQKDYFQVSPDVVTFKGGRLGICTEEPRAVLDVRGSVQMSGFSQVSGGGGNAMYTNSKYTVHKFTSSGTFTVNEPGLIEYIVVGGGGGGGSRHHGGGGGGGVLVGTMYASKGDYTVTVGAGGNGNAGGNTSGQGIHGNDSTFAGLIGMRGGGGARGEYAGYIGCSGGTNAVNNSNNIEIAPQGYGIQGWYGGRGNPTATNASAYAGGGGGGAGGAGGNALPQGGSANTNGGVGGPGRCIYGLGADDSDVYLGGGGGGDCSASSSGSAGSGGIGGGGNGSKGNAQAGHGEANTGGGGGGGGFGQSSPPNGPGGNGGSGVVYVRYLK